METKFGKPETKALAREGETNRGCLNVGGSVRSEGKRRQRTKNVTRHEKSS